MYPNTPEELLEALTLQEANLPIYKNDVGATADDITENSQDRANLATALANHTIAETDKQVVTQIKNGVYDGDTEDSIAPNPAFAIEPLPFPLVKAGAMTRYRARRTRFKSAKGFTTEAGIALGLDKPKSSPVSPADLVVALKLSDSGNYEFIADFKKQGQSGMLIHFRVKGTEKWTGEKTALTSPCKVKVPEPPQEGASVQLEVRGRLLKGNEQVGKWSPIYTITVNQ